MAQQNDSVNYGDILTVTIEQVLNGNIVSSDTLSRSTVQINDGVFYSTAVVYAYAYPVIADGSKYKITIHNNETGLTATATTGIVKDATIESPTANSINFTTTGNLLVKFFPGDLGTNYNVAFRFYYTETDSSGMPVTTEAKSFDWNLGDQSAESSSNDISYSVPRKDFFSVVAANILPSPHKWRHMGGTLDLIITGVTQELETYISLTNPTAAVTQDRPLYTNIENGVGIFGSRNSKPKSYTLHPQTLDSLLTNQYTYNLGFY
jgi:hypothetical protein